jgi:hypothetical protein
VSPLARTGLPVVGALILGALILGPTGAAGAANGQVCLGIVIDDGPNSTEQNWAPVATQVAQVAPGTSDLQALSAAGDTATQNNSGLVCAIDNFPANGLQSCLSTSGSGQYYYWSYWEGDPYTNTWTYANVGPASHTVSAGQTYVEGWRYQDPGADNPTATKPSVSPGAAFAQACPGVTPVPSGGSGGGGGGGSGGGGTIGSGSGSSPGTASPSASPTTTSPVAGGGSAAPRTAVGGTSNGTTTTSRPGAAANSPPGTSHETSTTTTAVGRGEKSGDGKAALADARRHGGSGGGDPALPIVIVAGVIALLGGLAWWRWRRRPLEE